MVESVGGAVAGSVGAVYDDNNDQLHKDAPPAARWQIRRRRRGTCDEASMSPRAAAGPSGLRITTAGVTSPNLANASRRRTRFRRPSSVNTPVLEHGPARVRVIAGALSVMQALSRASVSSMSGVTCHKFASARKPFFAGSWNHRRKSARMRVVPGPDGLHCCMAQRDPAALVQRLCNLQCVCGCCF